MMKDPVVSIQEASDSTKGVTFLLPGAMVKESEYDSIRSMLSSNHQLVVSFYINVLTASHEAYAQRVVKTFDDLRKKQPSLPNSYHVVGHSVGAEIALLLAAKIDKARVSIVVALDPVDILPSVFTSGTSSDLTLKDSRAQIYITWASGTRHGIPESHNARAIHAANANWIHSLIVHENAGHFAYTDHGGGWPGWLIPGGTKEGNDKARKDSHALIQRVITLGDSGL